MIFISMTWEVFFCSQRSIFIFSPHSVTSPSSSSSQQNESVVSKKPTRNKSYDYYLNHSIQQPIYRGQR